MPAASKVAASTPPQIATAGGSQISNEEWEGWMKWDNALEPTSPKGSDLSPPPLQFVSGSTGSTSPSVDDSLSSIQYSPVYSLPPAAKPTAEGKKRKSSAMNPDTHTPGTRKPRGQKISHNVIEKRYRSNLNDKIAKLRDCVPDLRTATPTVKKRTTKAANEWDGSDDDGDAGLKFNKATVLTKATDYIQQLERQNQRLLSELTKLKKRGGNVDMLRNPSPIIATGSAPVPILDTPSTTTRRPAPRPILSSIPTSLEQTERSTEMSTAEKPAGMIAIPNELKRMREQTAPQPHYGSSFESADPCSPGSPAFPTEVRGMIPIPEDLRRFREQGSSQAHYAPESSCHGSYVSPQDIMYTDETESSASSWPRSKTMSRVLVGSLVGLMFMESFSEKEPASSDPDGPGIRSRGLFSLPTELLTESRGFRAPIRQRIIAFFNSPASGKAASILLISAVFMTLCFAAFMYLAPRETKNVREGPVGTQTSTTVLSTTISSTKLASSTPYSSIAPSPGIAVTIPPDAPPDNRPYLTPPLASQPPDHAPFSRPLVAMMDHAATKYLGLDWFRSHHLDEEAARKGPDTGGESEGLLPFERLVPKLFFQRQNPIP